LKKIILAVIAFTLTGIFFSSCKKSDTSSSGPGGSSGSQLVRIQQGTDPTTDTVFKINYSGNNIRNIYDSIYYGSTFDPDTLTATYAGGLLVLAADADGEVSATYTYNGSGQLTEEDEMAFGQHNVYQYTYASGVVSQKTWSTDNGQGGAVTLSNTYKYTVSNGNLSEIKTYDAGNSLVNDMTFTYGSQANPFKQLALLNLGNILGLDNIAGADFASFDTYFDANVLTGYTQSGNTATVTNTFNSQQQPVKIVNSVPDSFIGVSIGTYTWQFSYN
jgi:YD repeat-containing protein